MDQRRYEILESYIQGNISEEERQKLEKELQSDKELKNDFKIVSQAITSVERYNLKADLESIHDQLYSPQRSGARRYLVYISGVAAAIILIASFWFIFLSKPDSSDVLFKRYFEPFPNYITLRDTEGQQAWEKGFYYYSLNDFEEAITYFERIDIPKDKQEDVLFYLGVCQLGLEKNQQAVITFSDLLQQSTKYRQQLHWYLSLAYLNEGELDKAKETLMTIDESEYEFDKARELLEQLGNQKETDNGSNPPRKTTQ